MNTTNLGPFYLDLLCDADMVHRHKLEHVRKQVVVQEATPRVIVSCEDCLGHLVTYAFHTSAMWRIAKRWEDGTACHSCLRHAQHVGTGYAYTMTEVLPVTA